MLSLRLPTPDRDVIETLEDVPEPTPQEPHIPRHQTFTTPRQYGIPLRAAFAFLSCVVSNYELSAESALRCCCCWHAAIPSTRNIDSHYIPRQSHFRDAGPTRETRRENWERFILGEAFVNKGLEMEPDDTYLSTDPGTPPIPGPG